jgi:hypothetical protein
MKSLLFLAVLKEITKFIWSRNKMRKALKLCLALVMAGSMAVGTAYAGDTEVVASGEAYWYFTNTSADYDATDPDTAEVSKKSHSSMNMSGDGGLYLAATNKGEQWTTSADVGTYFYSDGSIEMDHINLKMANDQFGLQFGTSDLGGAEKNPAYYAGARMDAGDELGDDLKRPEGKIVFTMPEVGLGVLYATGEVDHSGKDYEGSEEAQTTYYAVSFDKTMDAIDVSVQYEALSTAIDKTKNPGDEDGTTDGLSASDLGFGVAYSMDPMAFKFSYDAKTITMGGKNEAGDSYKAYAVTSWMFAFDFAIDDLSGVSAVYQSEIQDDKNEEVKNTITWMGVGYTININTIYVNVYYDMKSSKSDADEAETYASNTLGVEVGMGF